MRIRKLAFSTYNFFNRDYSHLVGLGLLTSAVVAKKCVSEEKIDFSLKDLLAVPSHLRSELIWTQLVRADIKHYDSAPANTKEDLAIDAILYHTHQFFNEYHTPYYSFLVAIKLKPSLIVYGGYTQFSMLLHALTKGDIDINEIPVEVDSLPELPQAVREFLQVFRANPEKCKQGLIGSPAYAMARNLYPKDSRLEHMSTMLAVGALIDNPNDFTLYYQPTTEIYIRAIKTIPTILLFLHEDIRKDIEANLRANNIEIPKHVSALLAAKNQMNGRQIEEFKILKLDQLTNSELADKLVANPLMLGYVNFVIPLEAYLIAFSTKPEIVIYNTRKHDEIILQARREGKLQDRDISGYVLMTLERLIKQEILINQEVDVARNKM